MVLTDHAGGWDSIGVRRRNYIPPGLTERRRWVDGIEDYVKSDFEQSEDKRGAVNNGGRVLRFW